MDTAFSCERKILVKTDFSKCVICQTVVARETLSKITLRGLSTFKDAMEARKDNVFDRLWSSMENPDTFLEQHPLCHRSCKSKYTHKKEIGKYVRKRSHSETDPIEDEPKIKRSTVDYKVCCFLCDKERDCKGIRQLILVATIQRQCTIHKKAKELGDEKLLFKIQGHGIDPIDMIAADFRYHKSCMDHFMNRRKSLQEVKVDVYEEAFNELINEISDSLLKERSGYYITVLLDRYRELLKSKSVTNAASYRTQSFRKRLINHFKDIVQIIPQRGKPSIVCGSDITVSELCILSTKLKEELDETKLKEESTDESSESDAGEKYQSSSLSVNSDLYATAKHLRCEMKQTAYNLTDKRQHSKTEDTKESEITDEYPKTDTNVMEISYEKTLDSIPTDLYNHIAWMMTNTDCELDSKGKVVLTEKQNQTVLNVASDIMASVTNLPMPKSVGLAIHILKQTGSKELVRVFNKFGHCISYDNAQRYISTIALEVDQQISETGLFIPTVLKPGLFTQCALDNLDFSESTKDGTTLHATSHNIYQYENNNPDSDTAISACQIPLRKTRDRSVPISETLKVTESRVSLKDRREARTLTNISFDTETGSASLIDDEFFIWSLLRTSDPNKRNEDESNSLFVKNWEEFCEAALQTEAKATIIGYGPLYPRSPTDPDVVMASLNYFVSLSNKIGQHSTIITADQAIYDILKGITNKFPDRYLDVVIRMGGFHIAENFMGSIGFYMKDSGFEDIVVESGVCKRGTVNKIISGKDYYLMLRCHSIMSEAMICLLWRAFQNRVDSDQLDSVGLSSSLHDLAVALESDDVISVNCCLTEVKRKQRDVSGIWEAFVENLGVTGRFWLMYVDMVLILKRYIHAERSGLWIKHLKEVENMIPYTISSQHAKYMVCLPLYLRDMKELPVKHPNVYENFVTGNFNVHRTDGKFNGIWTDLALEQTYNKEGKTTLFKGISQQPASRDKYIKTVPFMTKVSESVKAMVGIERPGHKHHGQSKSQDQKNMLCVEKIINVVNEQMINPFTCSNSEDLICISSGEKAENTNLISARSKGMEIMKLMEEGQSNVKPPKLTTFASKKKSKTAAESLVKIYQDESTVMRALCFFQGADDGTREIAFSHEWTNYPTSLFDTDQSSESGFMMRKGTKSDFLAYLIKEVGHEEIEYDSLPDSNLSTVYLIDTMAFINRYYKLCGKTFGDFLQAIVGQIIRLKPNNCKCVNIVGDRYDFEDSASLKADERFRRSQSSTQKEYFISESLEIVDWNAILHDVRNKANLLDFISSELQTVGNVDDVTFIVGGLSKVKNDSFALHNSEKCEIPQLSCLDHEEADTRIVAHLAYCVKNLDHTRAVIHATDTDIFIICMYHLTRLSILRELWVQKFDKYIALHDLVQKLCEKYECSAKELTSSLLVAYVFSGCDTVSYPFRRGKKLAAKVALSMVKDFPNLSNFGVDDFTVSEELKVEARKYFVSLYGGTDVDSLNVLRQHLFASSKTDLRALPPTEDAFHQHFLRALYQIGMYVRATLSDLCLPSPTQFGRKLVNNKLVPVLMCLPPKPMINTPTGCKCQKSKCLRNCSCAKSSFPCSVICLCLGKVGKCGRISGDIDSSESED